MPVGRQPASLRHSTRERVVRGLSRVADGSRWNGSDEAAGERGIELVPGGWGGPSRGTRDGFAVGWWGAGCKSKEREAQQVVEECEHYGGVVFKPRAKCSLFGIFEIGN